jgi:hypothetical protein
LPKKLDAIAAPCSLQNVPPLATSSSPRCDDLVNDTGEQLLANVIKVKLFVTNRSDCEGPLKCQWQPHVSTRGGCDPGINASVPAKGDWVRESVVWAKTARRW